jgi:hypothetical protein
MPPSLSIRTDDSARLQPQHVSSRGRIRRPFAPGLADMEDSPAGFSCSAARNSRHYIRPAASLLESPCHASRRWRAEPRVLLDEPKAALPQLLNRYSQLRSVGSCAMIRL